ncbi:hypothetical protein V8C42DRAFT_315974 [Trichoderma barbatum]
MFASLHDFGAAGQPQAAFRFIAIGIFECYCMQLAPSIDQETLHPSPSATLRPEGTKIMTGTSPGNPESCTHHRREPSHEIAKSRPVKPASAPRMGCLHLALTAEPLLDIIAMAWGSDVMPQ